MIIAVDLGNSRAKWAAHPGDLPVAGRFLADGCAAVDAIAAHAAIWASIGEPSGIVACSVARPEALADLARVASGLSVPMLQIVPRAQAAGVSNLYHEPARLGADRWAALVGARARGHEPALVVDAGTAMTVDALAADGRFLGGLIVPGFHLMRASLAGGTAQLPLEPGSFDAFPRCTADAIVSGALQALAGTVERMREAMIGAGHGIPRLLLTGGAAPLLEPLLALCLPIVLPQLVLEGALVLAAEERFAVHRSGEDDR